MPVAGDYEPFLLYLQIFAIKIVVGIIGMLINLD